MRRTFGSTTFRMFDRVIAAVLAVAALLYLLWTVGTSGPTGAVDKEQIRREIERIRHIQAGSKHVEQPLTADYLTGTAGGLRPDVVAVDPREWLFSQRAEQGVDWPRQVELELAAVGPNKEVEREVPPDGAGADFVVDNTKIVHVGWVVGKPATIGFTPVAFGTATVRVVRGAGARPLAEIAVTVRDAPKKPPGAGEPPGFTARAGQGQVELSWGTADVVSAMLKEYRIYRSESEKEQALWVRVIVPKGVAEGAELEVRRPNNDREPLAAAVFNKGAFALTDRGIQGGTTYWYSADTAAADEKDKPVVSKKTAPVSVQVEEPFKIKFYTLSRDTVALAVSVFVPGKGGGQWAEKRFIVERGQAVGYPVAEHAEGAVRLENVDFSTGYQLLDVLNDERRVRAVPVGGPEVEESTQKVLLIDKRGRIKVLWPSPRGP